jgi:hypothetical protein
VIPKDRGPFAGVIVQHGLPSTKQDFLPAGVDLARAGAVVILIDAPFNRPRHGRIRGDISVTAGTATSRSSSSSTCAGPSTCWPPGPTSTRGG